MRLAASLGLLLALPASASAAPFGELPFRPVSSAATCLRATGAPGELVRWVRGGVEVLAARPDGLAPVGTIALGTPHGCPAVAARKNGAGVLAASTGRELRVVLREPGGTWAAPITLATGERAYVLEAAVNARGDAVVLWIEYVGNAGTSLYAARRAAGGAFGPPERLLTGHPAEEAVATITAEGETILLFNDDGGVRLRTAPMGVRFPPARRLLRSDGFHRPALAAADDGRVLLAVPTRDGLVLFEREPGGELVRRPRLPGTADSEPDVVLGEGGAAVVTWGSETAVGAIVRAGPGAFGPPVALSEERPPRPNRDRSFGAGLIVEDPGDPPYEGGSRPRAVLGADGRVLLVWGIQDAGVRAATLTASGESDRQALGTTVRDQAGITPLELPGGRRAVAWTDNVPLFSAAPYAGRLHFALEQSPVTSSAPAPEIRVDAPRDRSLRPAQSLLLPVRCSAACDIRGVVDDEPYSDPGSSLPAAGTALLRFRFAGTPIAPRRPGPVRVFLRWSAPGSGAVATRTVRVRLRRLPAPRLPRILGLRARRLSGNRVEVRWRTDGPTVDAYWRVYGSLVRDPKRDGDVVTLGGAPAGDRRRHRTVLRDARRVRHVVVTLNPRFGTRGRRASVRIA